MSLMKSCDHNHYTKAILFLQLIIKYMKSRNKNVYLQLRPEMDEFNRIYIKSSCQNKKISWRKDKTWTKQETPLGSGTESQGNENFSSLHGGPLIQYHSCLVYTGILSYSSHLLGEPKHSQNKKFNYFNGVKKRASIYWALTILFGIWLDIIAYILKHCNETVVIYQLMTEKYVKKFICICCNNVNIVTR